jgi:hypothetical protein
MALVNETIEIRALPEDVWALAGDPGRIGEWEPALAGSTPIDEGRACILQDGAEILESVLAHSDEGRYYVSEITSSPLPLRSHTSRPSVHGHGGPAHVNWVAQFEADSPHLEPQLVQELGHMYRDGLATLRDRLEVDASA